MMNWKLTTDYGLTFCLKLNNGLTRQKTVPSVSRQHQSSININSSPLCMILIMFNFKAAKEVNDSLNINLQTKQKNESHIFL